MHFLLIAAEIVCLVVANLPGVEQPVSGSLLLVGFWCFGAYLGYAFARRGGDSR